MKTICLSDRDVDFFRSALFDQRKTLREELRAAILAKNQDWQGRVNDKINFSLSIEERLSS